MARVFAETVFGRDVVVAEARSGNASAEPADAALAPEARLLQQHVVVRVRTALEQLPLNFREVVVLREING